MGSVFGGEEGDGFISGKDEVEVIKGEVEVELVGRSLVDSGDPVELGWEQVTDILIGKG